MNTIGFFEIQSSEPEREQRFYESIFGWKFTRQESVPIEYYLIGTDTIFGGLLKRPVDVPPPGTGTNAFTCSVQVDNFDLTAQKIIDSGGRIAMPKFAVPGRCWQGYFMDAD